MACRHRWRRSVLEQLRRQRHAGCALEDDERSCIGGRRLLARRQAGAREQIEERTFALWNRTPRLASELLGVNAAAVTALAWLVEQPETIRAGFAGAAARVVERFDALTPATLRNEVLGLAPADLRWMGGAAPKKGRAAKASGAGTAKARAPRKASASRARKPKIRNRWAYANYMKKKRASTS